MENRVWFIHNNARTGTAESIYQRKLMLSLENLIINISLQLFSLTSISFLTSEQLLLANPTVRSAHAPHLCSFTGDQQPGQGLCCRNCLFHWSSSPQGIDIPPFLMLDASNKQQVSVSPSWRCLQKVGEAQRETRWGQDRIIYISLDVPFIGNTSGAFPELLMENWSLGHKTKSWCS